MPQPVAAEWGVLITTWLAKLTSQCYLLALDSVKLDFELVKGKDCDIV